MKAKARTKAVAVGMILFFMALLLVGCATTRPTATTIDGVTMVTNQAKPLEKKSDGQHIFEDIVDIAIMAITIPIVY